MPRPARAATEWHDAGPRAAYMYGGGTQAQAAEPRAGRGRAGPRPAGSVVTSHNSNCLSNLRWGCCGRCGRPQRRPGARSDCQWRLLLWRHGRGPGGRGRMPVCRRHDHCRCRLRRQSESRSFKFKLAVTGRRTELWREPGIPSGPGPGLRLAGNLNATLAAPAGPSHESPCRDPGRRGRLPYRLSSVEGRCRTQAATRATAAAPAAGPVTGP